MKNRAAVGFLRVADSVAEALMGNKRKQKTALLLLPMFPMDSFDAKRIR